MVRLCKTGETMPAQLIWKATFLPPIRQGLECHENRLGRNSFFSNPRKRNGWHSALFAWDLSWLQKKLDHGWPESITSQARSAQRCRMRSFSLHEAFVKQARDSTRQGALRKLVGASWSAQVALRKLHCAVALRKLLRASCFAQVAPASWPLQVAPCKLLCANCAPCKLLCASCSVQVALCKLLCVSCSAQVVLGKALCANWSVQVGLRKLLCATCSAQLALRKLL